MAAAASAASSSGSKASRSMAARAIAIPLARPAMMHSIQSQSLSPEKSFSIFSIAFVPGEAEGEVEGESLVAGGGGAGALLVVGGLFFAGGVFCLAGGFLSLFLSLDGVSR